LIKSVTLYNFYLAFRQFDTANQGKITVEDIKNYIWRKGELWSNNQASWLIRSVDQGMHKRKMSKEESKTIELDSLLDKDREEMTYNTFKRYVVFDDGTSVSTSKDEFSVQDKQFKMIKITKSLYDNEWFE